MLALIWRFKCLLEVKPPLIVVFFVGRSVGLFAHHLRSCPWVTHVLALNCEVPQNQRFSYRKCYPLLDCIHISLLTTHLVYRSSCCDLFYDSDDHEKTLLCSSLFAPISSFFWDTLNRKSRWRLFSCVSTFQNCLFSILLCLSQQIRWTNIKNYAEKDKT